MAFRWDPWVSCAPIRTIAVGHISNGGDDRPREEQRNGQSLYVTEPHQYHVIITWSGTQPVVPYNEWIATRNGGRAHALQTIPPASSPSAGAVHRVHNHPRAPSYTARRCLIIGVPSSRGRAGNQPLFPRTALPAATSMCFFHTPTTTEISTNGTRALTQFGGRAYTEAGSGDVGIGNGGCKEGRTHAHWADLAEFPLFYERSTLKFQWITKPIRPSYGALHCVQCGAVIKYVGPFGGRTSLVVQRPRLVESMTVAVVESRLALSVTCCGLQLEKSQGAVLAVVGHGGGIRDALNTSSNTKKRALVQNIDRQP
ncbi:hypothetical protein CBL_05351 [Carabus blaptoides fortunei]